MTATKLKEKRDEEEEVEVDYPDDFEDYSEEEVKFFVTQIKNLPRIVNLWL